MQHIVPPQPHILAPGSQLSSNTLALPYGGGIGQESGWLTDFSPLRRVEQLGLEEPDPCGSWWLVLCAAHRAAMPVGGWWEDGGPALRWYMPKQAAFRPPSPSSSLT